MFDQYVAVAEIKVCFYFRISWRNISHIWSPPTAVDALCVHCAVALGQVLWCMWVTVSHTRTESVKLKSSLNLKSDIYLPKCWVELSSNSRMIVHFALCVHCAVALGQVLWCMWVTVSHTRAESVKVKSSLNLRSDIYLPMCWVDTWVPTRGWSSDFFFLQKKKKLTITLELDLKSIQYWADKYKFIIY